MNSTRTKLLQFRVPLYGLLDITKTFYLYSSPMCSMCSRGEIILGDSENRAEVEEDDLERARFRDGKISSGKKKSRESNSGDGGNIGGKTVGGTIGARGGG
ncbi:hypothetical protein Tco_0802621 [Tanacetum coccineum]|uniref:Uncharacterized protein n=1 Tax=Tanacetum coccineum TaxID=301880 RepID=A0ABQ4ZZG8_9ASTR